MMSKDKEIKDLLLKAYCGYLPYGLMCDRLGHTKKLLSVKPDRTFCIELSNGDYEPNWFCLDDVKPYLRPMSSMTEKEVKEYKHLVAFSGSPNGAANFVDWLNVYHFDYRNLIEKGLAIEVTKENNPYKE